MVLKRFLRTNHAVENDNEHHHVKFYFRERTREILFGLYKFSTFQCELSLSPEDIDYPIWYWLTTQSTSIKSPGRLSNVCVLVSSCKLASPVCCCGMGRFHVGSCISRSATLTNHRGCWSFIVMPSVQVSMVSVVLEHGLQVKWDV